MAKAKLTAKKRAILFKHKPVPTPAEVKAIKAEPSFQKELELARARVGLESVDRVRWLLDFVGKDIDHLSQGQMVDLRWEVLAVTSPLNPQSDQERWDSTLFPLRSQQHRNQLEAEGKESRGHDRLAWLPFNDIHSHLKGLVDDFFSGRGWQIDRPQIHEILSFNPEHGTTMKTFSRSASDPHLINLIILWAFDLVYEERERLGVCKNPRCNRRFAATRKGRATFCSARCSAYVRVTTKRGGLKRAVEEAV